MRKIYFTPKTLAYTALLTAINILLNTISIPIGGGANYISFTYITCFIAGIFLGPMSGLLVGLIGDLLGVIIFPMGAWIPLITLSSALIGLIPGLVFKYTKLHPYAKLAISFVLVFLICTAGFNTLGLFLVYAKGKKTYLVYLYGRVALQTPVLAANVAIMYTIYAPIKKLVFADSNIDHQYKNSTSANNQTPIDIDNK